MKKGRNASKALSLVICVAGLTVIAGRLFILIGAGLLCL